MTVMDPAWEKKKTDSEEKWKTECKRYIRTQSEWVSIAGKFCTKRRKVIIKLFIRCWCCYKRWKVVIYLPYNWKTHHEFIDENSAIKRKWYGRIAAKVNRKYPYKQGIWESDGFVVCEVKRGKNFLWKVIIYVSGEMMEPRSEHLWLVYEWKCLQAQIDPPPAFWVLWLLVTSKWIFAIASQNGNDNSKYKWKNNYLVPLVFFSLFVWFFSSFFSMVNLSMLLIACNAYPLILKC